MLPFSRASAQAVEELEGAELDDLARGCVREIARAGPGRRRAELEVGDDGEPEITLATIWDPRPRATSRRCRRPARCRCPAASSTATAAWGVAVPADPALRPQIGEFVWPTPACGSTSARATLLDELTEEHERAAATVALSYAEDAELDDLELGGELHPFQRAGVRYALERRRTFIADEQGLGKTVQALAALEADEAFPAIVVCPAQHEADLGARDREVAARPHGRGARAGAPRPAGPRRRRRAEIVVLNYDILEAHATASSRARPRRWCSTSRTT